MDVQDMHRAIDLQLQKIDSHRGDNILPGEKDFFLNKAQDRFVKEHYRPNSDRSYEGFEGSPKRVADLRTLVKNNETVFAHPSLDLRPGIGDFGTDRVELPDDLMFLIGVRAHVYYDPTGALDKSYDPDTNTWTPEERPHSKTVYCRWSQMDDIYRLLDDPFNTTRYDSPIYIVKDNFIDIFRDNAFFVNSGHFDYIREPNDINIDKGNDCELAAETHQEIVDEAVLLMKNAMDSLGGGDTQILTDNE